MGEIILTELKYPDKFSSLMDQLLNKKLGTTPIRPPHDRGRDSYIKQENEKIKIYQYKFFKTAKDFNKKDVEESLDTAIKNYPNQIEEWILCLPREITSAEEDFLKNLEESRGIKISYIGESIIKNFIEETNFPIENYLESQLYKKNQKDLKEIKSILDKRNIKDKEIKFEILKKVVSHINSLEKSGEFSKGDMPIELKEKIKLNKLSNTFEDILKSEMTLFPQIDKYFRSGVISSSELNRLLVSLKMVYLKFKNKFENGDDIFVAMINEIIPDGCEDKECEAYITIVCYFFQSCEVFERC